MAVSFASCFKGFRQGNCRPLVKESGARVMMKKAITLLTCLLSVLVAYGQEPAPPAQEWCEWAFQQIPDHRDISEVDSKAFPIDFHTLLMIAFAIDEWECK